MRFSNLAALHEAGTDLLEMGPERTDALAFSKQLIAENCPECPRKTSALESCWPSLEELLRFEHKLAKKP